MRPSVESVLKLLDDRVERGARESIALAFATGRVLAEPIKSSVPVPGFVRAAMDGFAIRAEDARSASTHSPSVLTLVGDSRPARPYAGTLSAGQAVRITTGAPVPPGADAVLMLESAQLIADGRVLLSEPIARGKHVSAIGEDVRAGQAVLPAGRRLRPQDIGLLASIGMASVEVIRRPRIIIVATGDELLPSGSSPSGYSIVDSNSPMLASLAVRDGGEVLQVRHVPDQRLALRQALLDACLHADAILVSGGSSVGVEDHSPGVVAELGELAVHGIAIKPGGPTGIGFLPHSDSNSFSKSPSIPIVLLPGNPVACLCAYDLFAGRVIRRLGGRVGELPYHFARSRLRTAVASVACRTDYVRVKREGDEVVPLPTGASILSSTVIADGFILVPHASEGLTAGERVQVWLYDDR